MELLEIEKELKGPDKMAAMEKYDTVLVGLQTRLQEAFRIGLIPDDYEKCKPLEEAVVVARKLIRLQVRSTQDGN